MEVISLLGMPFCVNRFEIRVTLSTAMEAIRLLGMPFCVNRSEIRVTLSTARFLWICLTNYSVISNTRICYQVICLIQYNNQSKDRYELKQKISVDFIMTDLQKLVLLL